MRTPQNNTSSKQERVVVTGFGLMTPVGATSLDTVRAILEARSAYFAHETVLVPNDRYGSSLRGAPVSRIDDEQIPCMLAGDNRMALLLPQPVEECLKGIPAELQGRLDWKIIIARPASADILLKPLSEKRRTTRISSGAICAAKNPRTEFFSRMVESSETLLAQRAEAIVVACADSLCAPDRLEELFTAGLLKAASNPYGIMASEAAGAVLLERESTARERGAAILAGLASWGDATEPRPWPTGKPSKALGLTAAFHQAFERLDDKGAGVAHVITDENGERPRAIEWALTSGRIFPNPEKERHLWHPAVVTGDAGGALGAILFADAFTRLVLSTPPGERVALAVSDDGGHRQVLCLEHVEQTEREKLFMDIRRQLGVPEKEREEN